MIVGTAGHIDHGKTALVRALTGVDADRFQEEKARGLTIDLGFAYQPLDGGQILGFVDVPGHERFVHNMLAGAAGIDAALLIVAADDGPMPQTREHLAILDLLGIERGVVALTKTDLVDAERLTAATAQIETLLRPTTLSDAEIVPVSVVNGVGVARLRHRLQAWAAELPVRRAGGHFRLAVDRCFALTGTGVVVTGTVFAGAVSPGARLVVSPSGVSARVRGVHAQNQAAEVGRVGQRCALNLAGADIDRHAIRRGDWIVAEAIHAPSTHLDARLRLLASEERALRHWTPVHLHLASSHVPARVAVLEGEAIEPGATGLAQLVLERAIGGLRGDRFILRDQSAQRTIGGGEVLDPFASARGRRKRQRLAVLGAYALATPPEALVALLPGSPMGVEVAYFARVWNLTPAEQEAVLGEVDPVRVEVDGRLHVFARERWQALLTALEEALGAHHRRQPSDPGVTPAELRIMLGERLPRALFDAVVDALIRAGRLMRNGPVVHLPGHEDRLSANEQRLWSRMQPLLRASGLKPPRVRELARQLRVDEKPLRLLLRRVTRLGEAQQVSEELYFDPAVIARLATATQGLCERDPQGRLTVKQFREGTGVGRGVAVELLEYFDRSGFTLRVEDGRRLRRPAAEVFGPTPSNKEA